MLGLCPELLEEWREAPPWASLEDFADVILKHRDCLSKAVPLLYEEGESETAANAAEDVVVWASSAKAAEELAEFEDRFADSVTSGYAEGLTEPLLVLLAALHEAEGLLVEAARHAGASNPDAARDALQEAADLLRGVLIIDEKVQGLLTPEERGRLEALLQQLQ